MTTSIKGFGLALLVLVASSGDGKCAQEEGFDLRCAQFIADMTSRDRSVVVHDTAIVEAMFQRSGQMLDEYFGSDLRFDHTIPSVSNRQAMVGRACTTIPDDPVWRVVRLLVARSVVQAMSKS